MVLFSFCGCQRPEQQQQQQSTIQRLDSGGCAYSEVPVAERDELSNAIAWSIHHWIWGHRPGRNQQMEGHYLDHLAPLISSCSCTSGDTGQTEPMFVLASKLGKSVPFTSGNYSRGRTSKYCHYNRFYLVDSRKAKRFTEIQGCAWPTVAFSRGVRPQRSKTKVLS